MIKQSPSPTFVIDSTGLIVDVNDAFVRMYESPPRGKLIGVNAMTVPANIEQGLDKYMKEALAGNVIETPEMEFTTPATGAKIVTRTKIFPIIAPDGKTTHAVVVQEDITERKKAEEQVRKNAEYQRVMADAAIMYVVAVSVEEVYSIMARQLCKLTDDSVVFVSKYISERRVLKVGASAGFPGFLDFILKHVPGNLIEKEFPVTEEAYERLLTGRILELHGGVYEMTFGTISREVAAALEKLLSINKVYVTGIVQSEKLKGAVAICLRRGTVTPFPVLETFVAQGAVAVQHCEALKLLRASEERFRMLAENASDVIYRHRLYPYAGFEYISPSVEKITGYSPEEYYETPSLFADIVHPDDIKEFNYSLSAGQFAQPSQIRWIRKDGGTVWVELKRVTFMDDTGRIVAVEGIARDITQRVDAENEKEKLRAQLIHSARLASLGELASGLAHEIGNPLQTVLGNAELLLLDAKNDELEAIRDAAVQAKKIIENLMDFSRQREMALANIDLNETVEKSLALYGRQLNLQKINIVKKLGNIPKVKAAPSQINQVFLNLITNAQKAMPAGGTLTISTRRETSPPAFGMEDMEIKSGVRRGGFAAVSFQDTGVGILQEHLGRIFEPFFTTRKGGTGLGLSVSYGIIKKHGGEIIVKSAGEGKGAEFTVILPEAVGNPAVAEAL